MKIIFLAAGRGSRMRYLTDEIPKPMIKIKGKTLLDHKLEALPFDDADFVNNLEEIIFIVGYKKEIIESHFGNAYKNTAVRYVEQVNLDGTGGAIKLCEPFLTDKFLVLSGDDLYSKKDLESLIKKENSSMLVMDMKDKEIKGGQVIVDAEDNFIGLNEGIHKAESSTNSTLVNAGAYILYKDYFDLPLVALNEKEYGLPHTLLYLKKTIPAKVMHAKDWIQVTSPEDVERLENSDEIESLFL